MLDPLVSLVVAALVTGVLILLFWPDQGLIWRWQRTRQITERVLIEDALKHIHESEMGEGGPTVQSIAGAISVTDNRVAQLLEQMAARNLLQIREGRICLTQEGRNYALYIIRAHRLWERYLAEETGYADTEWHERAHLQEHLLSPAEVNQLAARLNYPTHDPHGDPIPTASGKIVAPASRTLTELSVGESARIVHLEDEPRALFAQLVAEGLTPGMEVRVTEITPQRIRFWANGDEHLLAPIVAANVAVSPMPEVADQAEPLAAEHLADLKPGERGIVSGISLACRGNERRRFFDLGILPGTTIEAALASPSGNPTAYRIRGTLIALRRDQANYIHITRPQEVA